MLETEILKMQQKNCKITMDKLLEFLRLMPEFSIPWKEHLNIKNYTITQFISYIEKQIPKEQNSLYEFQARIGQWIELLDHNNNKGRKSQR